MNKPKLILKKFAAYSISVLCFLLIASCSQKVSFITSTVVPSAQGNIKIAKDDNNNHTIDIIVQRLADPSRLIQSKKTYVVWMETESNGTKNIGQLNSSDSFFSSTMKASLHTVTPFKPTKIFVTAEDNANIQQPGSLVVLTTKSFN